MAIFFFVLFSLLITWFLFSNELDDQITSMENTKRQRVNIDIGGPNKSSSQVFGDAVDNSTGLGLSTVESDLDDQSFFSKGELPRPQVRMSLIFKVETLMQL